MTTLIDPAALSYCPCGNPIEKRETKDKDFVCRKCWEKAPLYFKRKLTRGETQFKRDQAKNQIENHARRRGARRERQCNR